MPLPPSRLIALHGFTMNGAALRRQMGPLGERLSELLPVSYPDAPHLCSAATVAREYGTRRDVPHPARMWWAASDDGSAYDGWETSLRLLRSLIEDGASPVLVGFSQGAIFAAALTAMSSMNKLPPIAAAVMISGALPRAQNLSPFLAGAAAVPLLHVWGAADRLMGDRPAELAARLGGRSFVWSGGHVVPRTGNGADAIVDFVARHAGGTANPLS